MTSHFEKQYDMEFEKDKIEEQLSSLDVIVGIYFKEQVQIRVIFNSEIAQQGLIIDETEIEFLLNIFFHNKVIFSIYVNPKSANIYSKVFREDGSIQFCFTIASDRVLRLNRDLEESQ